MGAEATGLSKLKADLLDATATIPSRPEVKSLNASVAALLALIEISRMRSATLGGRAGGLAQSRCR